VSGGQQDVGGPRRGPQTRGQPNGRGGGGGSQTEDLETTFDVDGHVVTVPNLALDPRKMQLAYVFTLYIQ